MSLIIVLLFGVSFLGVVSHKYKFPFPIVLLLSGVAISLIPGMPVLTLDPAIVFAIFLPPLLYEGAWYTSWHSFRRSIDTISEAAVGLVLLTTLLVAVTAHYLIPGCSWALGFLLGAIVSPPDAVAATSIIKGLGLHPRLIAILEGESLINDASGLIAYKYALLAVTTGNFVLWEAAGNFVLVAAMGIAIGLAIALILRWVHTRYICDPVVATTMTFLTPYASYLLAEHFHFSGVLAVVTTGLYLSFYSGKILSHQARIMSVAVWQVVGYVLNSIVFILLGLQLRGVIDSFKGEYSTQALVLYGTVISLLVIVIRFVWVLPVIFSPQYFVRRELLGNRQDKKQVLIFSWAGMRGVVSMAAALALPLTINNVMPFPHRNLIIFLTFCVIMATVIPLGLTLPWFVRFLGIKPYSIVMEEYAIRNKVVSKTIEHIEENLSLLPDELLNNIKSKYEVKYNRLQKTELPSNYFGQGKTLSANIFNEYSELQMQLIDFERNILENIHVSGGNEEVLRKMQRELDLEESRLQLEIYNG